MNPIERLNRIETLRQLAKLQGDELGPGTLRDLAAGLSWALGELVRADHLMSARIGLARTEIVLDQIRAKADKLERRLNRLEEFRRKTEGDARLLQERIDTLAPEVAP